MKSFEKYLIQCDPMMMIQWKLHSTIRFKMLKITLGPWISYSREIPSLNTCICNHLAVVSTILSINPLIYQTFIRNLFFFSTKSNRRNLLIFWTWIFWTISHFHYISIYSGEGIIFWFQNNFLIPCFSDRIKSSILFQNLWT